MTQSFPQSSASEHGIRTKLQHAGTFHLQTAIDKLLSPW